MELERTVEQRPKICRRIFPQVSEGSTCASMAGDLCQIWLIVLSNFGGHRLIEYFAYPSALFVLWGTGSCGNLLPCAVGKAGRPNDDVGGSGARNMVLAGVYLVARCLLLPIVYSGCMQLGY